MIRLTYFQRSLIKRSLRQFSEKLIEKFLCAVDKFRLEGERSRRRVVTSHVTQLTTSPSLRLLPNVSNCFESFQINLGRKTCVHSIVLFVFFHVFIARKFIKQNFIKRCVRLNAHSTSLLVHGDDNMKYES